MLAFGFWLCSAKMASGNSTKEEALKPKWDCLCGCVLSRASSRKIKPEQSEDKGIHFWPCQSRSACCYWSHISRGDLHCCCRKAIYNTVVITSPWGELCPQLGCSHSCVQNTCVPKYLHETQNLGVILLWHTGTVHTQPGHVCLINWLSAWRLRVTKPVFVAIMGLIYHCNFQ